MHKIMKVLPLAVLMLSSLYAVDARDQVRNDILKSFDEALQARQSTIDELSEAVRTVEETRAKRGEGNVTNSTESKIAETKAIGNISQSVAKVEMAKIQTKEKIVKAIVKVDGMEADAASPEKIEQEKALSTAKIAKAVAAVEIAKAKAAKNIIAASKNVEMSKIKKQHKHVDNAAALTIAKNRSAVKIAKSVSAVEITQAVSKVKIAKVLLDENVVLSLNEKYKDLTVEEIKAKARAEISTIESRMEVAHAKALSDIAKIVSFVEIAEAIKEQDVPVETQKRDHLKETYSREFIILHTK